MSVKKSVNVVADRENDETGVAPLKSPEETLRLVSEGAVACGLQARSDGDGGVSAKRYWVRKGNTRSYRGCDID